MAFEKDNFGAMTAEEYDQCLTQEQADALPQGTAIWFHNVQHQLIPERITYAVGQVSKEWKKKGPGSNACLSDFFQTPLYNVGKDTLGHDGGSNPDFIKGKQMVWLRED